MQYQRAADAVYQCRLGVVCPKKIVCRWLASRIGRKPRQRASLLVRGSGRALGTLRAGRSCEEANHQRGYNPNVSIHLDASNLSRRNLRQQE
jgi:hypothetical protein